MRRGGGDDTTASTEAGVFRVLQNNCGEACSKGHGIEPRNIAVSLDTETRVEEVWMRPWQSAEAVVWGVWGVACLKGHAGGALKDCIERYASWRWG
jgi:hypothetical protein